MKRSKILNEYFSPILASALAIIESIIIIVDQINQIVSGNTVKIGIRFFFIFLLFLAFIISVGVIVLSFYKINRINKEEKAKEFDISDKEGINNYLIKFIEKSGKTAILSHDMTWIEDDERFKILEDKAKKSELLLFLPEETRQSKKLQDANADVRYFGSIINDPALPPVTSRFTIVDWESQPRLTYPFKNMTEKKHINCEYCDGEPATRLAVDLMKLLIHLSPEGIEQINRRISEKEVKPKEED
jgi:Na+-transporting methylmalonyl-CoA/oxaloacetate decarboxylase gamma subunit